MVKEKIILQVFRLLPNLCVHWVMETAVLLCETSILCGLRGGTADPEGACIFAGSFS